SRSIHFEREVGLPIEFKGIRLDCGYRMDFVIASKLIVEVKAVEALHPLHSTQLLTYLRLSRLRLGLLLNFHAGTMKQGIKRVVNNF
ncbi:MAG TPA: GxxExxY protein, partial [Gemmatimonadales bacterium]|nr:GxxExxY protein [Gemmatimonadales bacterium]